MIRKKPNQKSNQASKKSTSYCNTASAQRERLLTALMKGPVTTQMAREELDILHPAGRIQELREDGHNIVTYWETIETELGKHRVAKYVLFTKKSNTRKAA